MLQVTLSWAWMTPLILFFAFAYLIQSWLKKRNHNHSKKILPPGPKSLPLLGHLHLLGKNPHQDLHNLAKKYGPIMFIRLGFVPNIVISSPEAAEQFLKTHDLTFASRPPVEALKYILYEQRNISYSPYGTYWRNMRKLVTVELLSNVKIAFFQSIRKQELSQLIEFVKEASRERVPVDLSAKVLSLNADMDCRMILGKKYMDKEFGERGLKAVIRETMLLVATPNIGDYFPCVGALDLQGLNRRCKGVSKIFDSFLEKIIEEHIQSRDIDNKTQDFVDVMLKFMESKEAEFRIDRRNIKAIILDILLASIDTSATIIEWLISELLKHPNAMKKARDELEEVVGLSRMVEESDLEKLDYLYMVIKESFRLHPPTSLLPPREAMQDCVVSGYHIPRKARVIINACAIGKDPNVWKNPEEFIPERFIGSTIDVKGRDFQLIPFGAGRRGCPGMQLGLLTVRLVVAQLLHCFDWELPEGMMPGDLDMSEEFGVVTSRAKHLYAVPTYRLNK